MDKTIRLALAAALACLSGLYSWTPYDQVHFGLGLIAGGLIWYRSGEVR